MLLPSPGRRLLWDLATFPFHRPGVGPSYGALVWVFSVMTAEHTLTKEKFLPA